MNTNDIELLESLVPYADPSKGEAELSISLDLRNRVIYETKIVVFANEKGGVGKSTLAFHCCAALANAGKRVLAIDIDTRQKSLFNALTAREVTARKLGVRLGQPKRLVMDMTSGAEALIQEMRRLGLKDKSEFVVIDIGGADSRLARRAITLAHTLVTPVNNSFIDLESLGMFNPFTMEFRKLGYFAELILQLGNIRQDIGLGKTDWFVVPNRKSHPDSANRLQTSSALERTAQEAGFRIIDGLGERVAFRELALLGLTVLDLGKIPEVGRTNPVAMREVHALLKQLQLLSA